MDQKLRKSLNPRLKSQKAKTVYTTFQPRSTVRISYVKNQIRSCIKSSLSFYTMTQKSWYMEISMEFSCGLLGPDADIVYINFILRIVSRSCKALISRSVLCLLLVLFSFITSSMFVSCFICFQYLVSSITEETVIIEMHIWCIKIYKKGK